MSSAAREFFDLLLAQAVEGRVVGVEAALHRGGSGAGGTRGQPRPRRAGSQCAVAPDAPMPVSERTYCAS